MGVNTDDYSLYGKILFIDEEITYKGQNFSEFEADFQAGVEKHIQSCLDNGKEPPFS